jgi:succinyl-CoA synthetase beta subunit
MARVAITEYAAKRLILGNGYDGITLTKETAKKAAEGLQSDSLYVVKIDVGIKKRGKQGLLRLNVSAKDVQKAADELFTLGHARCLVEKMSNHPSTDEKYISLDLTRDGALILQSEHGGVEVEGADHNAVNRHTLSRVETLNAETSYEVTGVPLNDWLKAMGQYHISFLEVNPYVMTETGFLAVDMAAEIDSTKANRLPEWVQEHILYKKAASEAEAKVLEQDARTQAALNLHTLNANGSILTLFSGGGASLVALDSLVTAGLADQVINYSEYSGAPTRDETAEYVRTLLSVLFDSKASKKVIVIAGGVANFTDVMATFMGIVDAFTGELEKIKKQGITVVVRRGGPNQLAGLAHLKNFLETNGVTNEVHDPSLSLGAVGNLVKKYL